MPYDKDILGRAISVMTAWSSDGDDTSFMKQVAAELASQSEDAPIELIVGLSNLCGILLVRIEELGVDMPSTLQDIAITYGVSDDGV